MKIHQHMSVENEQNMSTKEFEACWRLKIHQEISRRMCLGLLGSSSVAVKRLGISSHLFSSGRPRDELHSVLLNPVGPLVQCCPGEKTVSPTKTGKLPLHHSWYSLKNLLFKYSVAPDLTLRTGMSAV